MAADHPEVNKVLEDGGVFGLYDPSSFDAMEALCMAYNKAVDKYIANKVS